MNATLVCLRAFSTRAEAEIAKAVLEDAGIGAVVSTDDAGGMRPELAFTTGGAKVFVPSDEVTAARELLHTPETPEELGGRAVYDAQFRGCSLTRV